MSGKKLLNLQEAADRLGLSLHTARRWASQRRLPGLVLVGTRAIRVDPDALDRYMEDNALAMAPRLPASLRGAA